MKIIESKKFRAPRIPSRPHNAHRRGPRPVPQRSAPGAADSLPDILTSIDLNDSIMKSVLIDIALSRFLKDRPPVNTSFRRYLGNFDKFNVLSLLCACSYMESAKIASKGDIRTFIYIFLGFNLLSSKYLDDYCVWNSSYATLWGIDCEQASQLEVFALRKLNYELGINTDNVFRTISEAIYKAGT